MPAPRFATASAASRPLHVVSTDDLPAWKAAQPTAIQAWLDSAGFDAALGETRLLPGADGTVAAAVVGHGTARTRARTRFGVAKAAALLPAGDWHIATPLSADDAREAALGWLLASYRFDRYRPGKKEKPTACLVAPEGVDA
ncbi:MAG: leucyl aminopeptidase family protein, partial [Paracoccaceae bacterium]